MSRRQLSALLAAICVTGSTPPPLSTQTGHREGYHHGQSTTPPQRLFISGHSLTDRPFPDFLAAIAERDGHAFVWNMQHLAGSSLRDRALGDGNSPAEAYRRGTDRHGRPADVLGAFGPAGGQAYDGLILAEQHTLLESLIWKDMIGQAADFAGRFRAASPNGTIFLFTAWLNLDEPEDARRWIAYEKVAARAWRCAARQIERTSASRGHHTRIVLIPAAEALAALVAAASAHSRKSGAPNARAVLEMLFADDVHLTRAGTYFVALVAHGVLHENLPADPWAPPDLEPKIARELQRFARRFLERHLRHPVTDDVAACRTYFRQIYVPHYLSYVRDARWQREGVPRAYLKWARYRIVWPRLLGQEIPANPLREP